MPWTRGWMPEKGGEGVDGKILCVRGLTVHYCAGCKEVKAVDRLDFSLARGETLGIVGESGCGKSTAALAVMGLIPSPAGRLAAGEILFKGKNLTALPEEEMRKIRGSEISMIFQEPMTSLNPVLTIGRQVSEVYMAHRGMEKKEALEESKRMLALVGLPDPGLMLREYPHRLSGGMRQRVMIAMALACNPEVMIADEPTSALDVTVQAQILRLIMDLKERLGTAIILITHNLGVIAETAQKVLVMYAGRAVEYSDVYGLFKDARHPYTIGLLGSVPEIKKVGEKLGGIEGEPPSPLDNIKGCRFHPRCRYAREICRVTEPAMKDIGGGHFCACHLL